MPKHPQLLIAPALWWENYIVSNKILFVFNTGPCCSFLRPWLPMSEPSSLPNWDVYLALGGDYSTPAGH